MKSGRLRHPCTLLALQGEPAIASDLGLIWCDIGATEGNVSHAPGLRQSAPITAWARWDDRLVTGRYLQLDGRLWHIDDRRDPKAQQAELVMSLTELVGEPATWQPVGGVESLLRVARVRDVGRVGEYWKGAERYLDVEVALIEGRPSRGDQLVIAGAAYQIAEVNVDASDAVVWQYRVRPQ